VKIAPDQVATVRYKRIAGIVVTIEASTAPQPSSKRAVLSRLAIVRCFFLGCPTTIPTHRHQTGDVKPYRKYRGVLGSPEL
jgi:hypothetical protein